VNDKTIDTSKTIVTFNGGIENINDASFNNDICTHMSEAEVKKIIAHAQEKVIHEAVITPEHDKRTESRLFRETKKRLKEDGRDYCWICGAKNPEAHLEIHHFLAEWSLAGVVDYDKLKKLDRDFFIKVEGDYSENYIDKQLTWLYFNSSGSTFYGHKKETGTSDYNEFKKGKLYILDGILR
jgi:hypothetical protein